MWNFPSFLVLYYHKITFFSSLPMTCGMTYNQKTKCDRKAAKRLKGGEDMEEKDWLDVVSGKNQVQAVVEMNRKTERYGLSLTEEEAGRLVAARRENLKEQQRVEFGEGILPKLLDIFCDSPYLTQNNYADTCMRLQEIFYLYKNETLDELTDDELLEFMREQFDAVCFGDLDYLEGTCLDIFSQAVRAGYRGFRESGGRGEFEKFDIVRRWDKELFLQALNDLM